jgi:hypothetical protein
MIRFDQFVAAVCVGCEIGPTYSIVGSGFSIKNSFSAFSSLSNLQPSWHEHRILIVTKVTIRK